MEYEIGQKRIRCLVSIVLQRISKQAVCLWR